MTVQSKPKCRTLLHHLHSQLLHQDSHCLDYERWDVFFGFKPNYKSAGGQIEESTKQQQRNMDHLITAQDAQQYGEILEDENIFFRLMERVGTMGKYQIVCFTIWCLSSIIGGGLIFITPYIFFQDPYQCDNFDLTGTTCYEYVCNLAPDLRKPFVPEPSIYSLANRFGDSRCPQQLEQLTFVITLAFAGNLAGTIFLALLGGILSKSTFLFFSLFMKVVGLTFIWFGQGIWTGGIGLFLCLFGGMMNLQVCYTYITETVSKVYRQKFSMVLSSVYSIGGIYNALCFYAFPNYQTVLLYFYGIPTVILLGCLLYFVKNPPFWLVTQLTAAEALKQLQFIAKMNEKHDFDMTEVDMEEIQLIYKQRFQNDQRMNAKKQTFTVVDLFRYKSLRKITLVVIVIDASCALMYFGPSLLISQFNFSIYLNGLIVAGSQFFSSIVSIFIVNITPRRTLAIAAFTVVLISSIILNFIWDQDHQQQTTVANSIWVLFFIFVVQFALTCQYNFQTIYINELYPTQVRMFSIGVIKTVGACILLFQNQIINICLITGFRIMTLFAILSALSIFCSYVLPETLGKTPPDVIEELRTRPCSLQEALDRRSRASRASMGLKFRPEMIQIGGGAPTTRQ